MHQGRIPTPPLIRRTSIRVAAERSQRLRGQDCFTASRQRDQEDRGALSVRISVSVVSEEISPGLFPHSGGRRSIKSRENAAAGDAHGEHRCGAPFGHRSTVVVARRACSETSQHSGQGKGQPLGNLREPRLAPRGSSEEPRGSAGRPARAAPGCLVDEPRGSSGNPGVRQGVRLEQLRAASSPT